MDILLIKYTKLLYKAWKEGSKALRWLIIFSTLTSLLGIVIGLLNYKGLVTGEKSSNIETISIVLIIVGAFISLIPISKEIYEEQEATKTDIRNKEQQLERHPEEVKLAWDIARIRLEGYLKRNLGQVSAIFWFSMLATFIGLVLIIYGSIKAFEKPDNLNPSIIVTISGAVVNFLGATLLVIHRYTMEQANQYVQVLERINAVGMSVQIMESIDKDELKLKEQTKAEISKRLLDLYASKVSEKRDEKKESSTIK